MSEDEVVQLPVLVIVGPTASGKSSLAVRVALELIRTGAPAEVVNTDSMVVYRGMDIGTAKPTAAERGQVRHHLVDILDVTETASVADFQTAARAVITECRTRGVIPILVGGSALYTRAIVDHFDFPGTDPVVRQRWQSELDQRGVGELYAELSRLDPTGAAAVEPNNGRRIVRALEVLELTGGFRPQLPQWSYALDGVVQVGLHLDRAEMDDRIARRVDQMWADGLVAEVQALIEVGLRDGLTASKALGYAQVLAHLDGSLTESEAKERTITGTRRFSRKQLGWYRRDPRIHWLPAGAEDAVEQICSLLMANHAAESRADDVDRLAP